ncbi:phosphatidylserine decarboxylase [Acidaminobacterium chupaoyuni]
MSENNGSVHFLYATKVGRILLKGIMAVHADKLAAKFLWTKASKPLVGWYAKKHSIPLENKEQFSSFREFFIRTRPMEAMDEQPDHLISPCDGWLSVYPIHADSSFAIKGSRYRLRDFLQDETLEKNFQDGVCFIFRLCASDYHHYCYIDDGFQGTNHFIPGVLHSVQPIACETYPVYTLNRRMWTLFETEHFGPVIQTEIGALVVGGIVNEHENKRVTKGMEKGHFELAGSTIVILFEKEKVKLLPEIAEALESGAEFRVHQGMWIATAVASGAIS